MFILLATASVTPLTASGIGFIGGAVTKFILSQRKVFHSNAAFRVVAPRYCLAIAIQATLNYFLLKLLISWTDLIWVSQILTTGCITFINYLIYYFWVFK
ncbi:hypothetical protein GCU85_08575 [Cardiobacteriales bacterium ML27]|uniref:GtrA/DPMS transmembrane domain-containing protein n=2 Tax=Ostreibacterium oceani TaxID=2654998 RepID=A0A6N7F1W0_9GAMM|nr:hypothetical protein [Ostreibacterium oceani]